MSPPRRSPKTTTLICLLLLAATAAAADRVILTDGTTLTGRVLSEAPDGVLMALPSGEFLIPRRLVKEVVRETRVKSGDGGAPPRLTRDAEKLAEGAIARLTDPDPLVRRSALLALRTLGPPAKPFFKKATRRPDLGPEARRILLGLLRSTPGDPPKGVVPARAYRLLKDPEEAEKTLVGALGLTTEQRERVRPVLAECSRRLLAAIDSPSDPGEVDQVVGDLRSKLGALLTDVQWKKLEAILGPDAGD